MVADASRARMLCFLLGGEAARAGELAQAAAVSAATASGHLAKLLDAGLVACDARGRHRYYRLADHQVAAMLESIMGVAATLGPRKVLPGPRDAGMREARVCYDHLAGTMGVALFDGLVARGVVIREGERLELTRKAPAFFASLEIDVAALRKGRRPVCRACLDWSVRRTHLAGALGAAIYDRVMAEKWARRQPDGRAVTFTPKGREIFSRLFLADAA